MSSKRCKQKALFALEQMDLGDLADKNVNQLSGGQKQRVAIARAVANNPSYILADEPTGALDTKTADEIIGVLKEMNERGITVIVVTHEKTVSDFCDRVINIHDGIIV